MKDITNNDYVEIKNILFNKYKKMTFSKKECAEILGVSTQTIDRLRKARKIQEMNISRFVLFSIEEIARIISRDTHAN